MEALQRDVTITLPRPAHLQVVRLVARAGETPVSIADGRWIFPELVKTGSATAPTATATAAAAVVLDARLFCEEHALVAGATMPFDAQDRLQPVTLLEQYTFLLRCALRRLCVFLNVHLAAPSGGLLGPPSAGQLGQPSAAAASDKIKRTQEVYASNQLLTTERSLTISRDLQHARQRLDHMKTQPPSSQSLSQLSSQSPSQSQSQSQQPSSPAHPSGAGSASGAAPGSGGATVTHPREASLSHAAPKSASHHAASSASSGQAPSAAHSHPATPPAAAVVTPAIGPRHDSQPSFHSMHHAEKSPPLLPTLQTGPAAASSPAPTSAAHTGGYAPASSSGLPSGKSPYPGLPPPGIPPSAPLSHTSNVAAVNGTPPPPSPYAGGAGMTSRSSNAGPSAGVGAGGMAATSAAAGAPPPPHPSTRPGWPMTSPVSAGINVSASTSQSHLATVGAGVPPGGGAAMAPSSGPGSVWVSQTDLAPGAPSGSAMLNAGSAGLPAPLNRSKSTPLVANIGVVGNTVGVVGGNDLPLMDLTGHDQLAVRQYAVLTLHPMMERFFAFEELMELVETRKPSVWSKMVGAIKPPKKDKIKHEGVFGVPLEVLIERSGVETDLMPVPSLTAPRIPAVLEAILRCLLAQDLAIEGIFRKNGNIRKLRQLVDEAETNWPRFIASLSEPSPPATGNAGSGSSQAPGHGNGVHPALTSAAGAPAAHVGGMPGAGAPVGAPPSSANPHAPSSNPTLAGATGSNGVPSSGGNVGPAGGAHGGVASAATGGVAGVGIAAGGSNSATTSLTSLPPSLATSTDPNKCSPEDWPGIPTNNPIQVAAFLKKFLRDLPEPLLTFKLHRLFVCSQKLGDEHTRRQALRLICCLLPKANFDVLVVLIWFFRQVASFARLPATGPPTATGGHAHGHGNDESTSGSAPTSSVAASPHGGMAAGDPTAGSATGNRMDLDNLAVVLTPNILFSKSKNPLDDENQLAIETVRMLLSMDDDLWNMPEYLQAHIRSDDSPMAGGSGAPGTSAGISAAGSRERLGLRKMDDVVRMKRNQPNQQQVHEVVAANTVDHQKTKGLFQPFVTVGHVTADLPFSIQARGDAFFLTTSIGHAFQIFNMQTMKVLFVSPPLPGKITALTAHRDLTYVAVGGAIHVHHRSKPVERITLPATPGNVAVSAASLEAGIIQLLIFGDYLLALSAPHNALMIFSRSTRQFLNRIDFPDTFTPVKMLHPSTYVNKILIASAQGSMVLYNLHTLMLLYTFNSLRSPITTLAQSPILDVVAIGTLDGRIVLHDLKRDEVVFMLSQAGPVMALSFKNVTQTSQEEQRRRQAALSDDEDEVEPNNLMTSPLLASATNDGTVFIWNLNTRRVAHTMQAAHDASIPSMQFLNGQPLLITGGADNAIKTWLFDQPDRPRLLRQRSGHARPPTRVHFYPSDNHVVLSAGQDGALRSSHMVRENANREFSQKPLMGFARRANQAKSGGKAHDRIQPVTAWDMNPLRDRDFDSI
ncbi:hypothetical protein CAUPRSCDRAFT_11285, partial [Caulochytrium protostelioides]